MYTPEQSYRLNRIFFIFSLILVIGSVAFIIYSHDWLAKHAAIKLSSKQMPTTVAAKPEARQDLAIKRFSWQKSADGTIGIHSFSVSNASTRFVYPAFSLRLSYYSELGDEVGHVDTLIRTSIGVGKTIQFHKLEIRKLDPHADGADMTIL